MDGPKTSSFVPMEGASRVREKVSGTNGTAGWYQRSWYSRCYDELGLMFATGYRQ